MSDLEEDTKYARIDGKDAFRKGQSRSENPHHDATPERRWWNYGWDSAQGYAAKDQAAA